MTPFTTITLNHPTAHNNHQGKHIDKHQTSLSESDRQTNSHTDNTINAINTKHILPYPRVPIPSEPILAEDTKRYSVYPIQDTETWSYYKAAEASFWTVEEVDLSCNKPDWDHQLKQAERDFLSQILAFFATADGIVAENLCNAFAHEVQQPEVRCFYGMQIAIENIHNEMYGLLIQTYISNPITRQNLFQAVTTHDCINRKAQWTLHWCNKQSATFAQRLVAFAAVEGIFFSSSFAAIFWFKKRGLLAGLCTSNALISRDEGLHCEFACHLHNKLISPATPITIQAIIRSAVTLEQEFAYAILPNDLLGMNAQLMNQYIEYCADVLLQLLHQPPLYHVSNPFDFMEAISLTSKSNFFEKQVTEYALAGITTNQETTQQQQHYEFSLDEEF